MHSLDSGPGVPTLKAIKNGMKTVVSGLGWDEHFILHHRMFRSVCIHDGDRIAGRKFLPVRGCRREETRKAKRSVS